MSPHTPTTAAVALGLVISSTLSWVAFSMTSPTSTPPSPAPLARSEPAGTQALSADAFVDSIGVNTHLQYGDTTYGDFEGVVVPRLTELGVRHVRDAAYTGPGMSADSEYYRRTRVLAGMGIGLDLTTSLATSRGAATDYSRLAQVQSWTGGAVESFEGVNEPDLSGLSDWVSQAQQAQASLTDAVRGTPALDDLDVLVPSVTSPSGADALGNLSADGDRGNLHNYVSDRNPETPGWGDDGYGSLSWNLRKVADVTAPRLPTVSSETGYYTSPVTGNGISRAAAGTYVPRLLMHQFGSGVSRTYLYELLDEHDDAQDPESNYGLVDAAGEPKAAFRAVASMIGLLADPGPAFTPDRLAYQVSGDTDSVDQVLLQKRDGTFYLALWSTAPTWDSDHDSDLAVPAQPVTVSLPSGYAASGLSTLDATGAMAARPLDAATLRFDVGPTISFLRVGRATSRTAATADVSTVPPTQPAPAPTHSAPVTPHPEVVVSRTDPAHDLVRTGPARTRDISRAADIRAVRFVRSAHALQVEIQVSDLPRQSRASRSSVAYEVTTPGVVVRTGPRTSRGTRQGSCGAARSTLDPSANRITMTVPLRCLPDEAPLRLEVTAEAVFGAALPGTTRWTDTLRSPAISW